MKYSARALFFALVGTWLIATAPYSGAEQIPSNVEALIAGNRWKEASRKIFQEAKFYDKYEWSIPAGQANAGYLEDALDTISGIHANTQPDALLALVADVPSIPPKRSAELVRRALDLSRAKSGKFSNYLKSGELAKVALYYSAHGSALDARAIFAEALRAAESAATEEGSGGYRRITEALVRDPKGGQDWMVVLVAKDLQRQEKTANTVFAYRDLAQVAGRLANIQMASELIEAGISAAQSINQDSMKKLALEGLGNVAFEVGYKKSVSVLSPYTQAVQQARSGNLQRALAMASGLSTNLYVDHGQAAHKRVFDDAVKRNDLEAALYFAEHPVRPVSWMQVNAWRQVAELQVKKGAKQEAANSYLRASKIIFDGSEPVRHLQQIKSALNLGASMRQNGLEAEGRKVTLAAQSMIGLIPERRVADRVSAATSVAEALWCYGMYAEAKQYVLRAYRTASGYADKNGKDKARLLSELGRVTTTFIAKVGEKQLESRGWKKVN